MLATRRVVILERRGDFGKAVSPMGWRNAGHSLNSKLGFSCVCTVRDYTPYFKEFYRAWYTRRHSPFFVELILLKRINWDFSIPLGVCLE